MVMSTNNKNTASNNQSTTSCDKVLPSCSQHVNDWLQLHGFDLEDGQKSIFFHEYHRYLTPIARAAEFGEIEVCKTLFQSSAKGDVRQPDSKGCTPMIYAAMNGHLEVCQWLYTTAGAQDDIIISDNNEQTPLHWACANGRLEVVQWLLKVLPSNYNHKNLKNQNSRKYTQLRKDDINNNDYRTILQPTKQGQRPLYLACSNGHVDTARYLITQGALHSPDIILNNTSSSSPRNQNNIIWKLNKHMVMKDVSMSFAEPILFQWCSDLIESNETFKYFLKACSIESRRYTTKNLVSKMLLSRNSSNETSSFESFDSSDLSTLKKMRLSNDDQDDDIKTNSLTSTYMSKPPKNPLSIIGLANQLVFMKIAEYAAIPKGAALRDFKELRKCLHPE